MKNSLLHTGLSEIYRLATKEKLWGEKRSKKARNVVLAIRILLPVMLACWLSLVICAMCWKSLSALMVGYFGCVLYLCARIECKHLVAKILCLVKEYKDKYGIPLVNQ